MESNPWYKNLAGPFEAWPGPVGVKTDGGGSIRGCARIGKMIIHRAVCNKDKEGIVAAVDAGEDINEVEAAGNTPLHMAAFEGWVEGAELLISLGVKINASNNAGDRPWNWAKNMGHREVMELLEMNGADKQTGLVLVQEHVPKVKDFYEKKVWKHHPKPYSDWMEWRLKKDKEIEDEAKKSFNV